MALTVGRIRRAATFRALARPDGRARKGPVSVVFTAHAPEAADFPVVGYAIGRREGGAVVRNRLRRRLREAVRASGTELEPGAYLVRAAAPAAEMPFAELSCAVRVAAQAAACRPGREGRDAR